MFRFNFLAGALFEGTRVSSTLNSQIREYRSPAALPPLTPDQREIIVGCALGDLRIAKWNGCVNAHLQFEQGSCNSSYLMYLYTIFEAYCGTPPPAFLDLTCSVQNASGHSSLDSRTGISYELGLTLAQFLFSRSSFLYFILRVLKPFRLILVIFLQLVP
jgi:hypothetical protein